MIARKTQTVKPDNATQKDYVALKCLHCHGYKICKKYGDIEKAHLCNGPVKKKLCRIL